MIQRDLVEMRTVEWLPSVRHPVMPSTRWKAVSLMAREAAEGVSE